MVRKFFSTVTQTTTTTTTTTTTPTATATATATETTLQPLHVFPFQRFEQKQLKVSSNVPWVMSLAMPFVEISQS